MIEPVSEPWNTAPPRTGPVRGYRADLARADLLDPAPPVPEAAPRRRTAARRAPGLVAELDLDAADGPMAVLAEPTEVLALVRLHRRTLGVLDLRLPAGAGLPTALRRAAVMQLGAAIAEHVRRDRESADLPWQAARTPVPACFQRRADVLADPPPISVIVGSRGHPDGLRRCLDSLAAVDYPAHEVLVVDRGPHFRAARNVVEGARGRVRYLRCARPGAAAAHRLGAAAADGRILAFTDDGSVVDRDWLAAIAEAFRGDRVGFVTGLVMPVLHGPSQDGVPRPSWGGPGSAPNLACTAHAFAYRGTPRAPRRTIYVPDALVWYQGGHGPKPEAI